MEDPYRSPKEEPGESPQRRAAKPAGRRIARWAFILYGVFFLLGGFAACNCPGFYVCMAVCAVLALVAGSRIQRIVSVALLLVAILGFVVEWREEQEMSRRLKRIQEAPAQR
jgi:hypothetical protein